MAERTPEAVSERELNRQLRRAHKEVALAEARYTARLMEQLQASETRLAESQFVLPEPDDGRWTTIGGRERDFAQRRIMKNDVSGYAMAPGDF